MAHDEQLVPVVLHLLTRPSSGWGACREVSIRLSYTNSQGLREQRALCLNKEGRAVQARPRLESAFQPIQPNEEKIAFNLNLFSELATLQGRGARALAARH